MSDTSNRFFIVNDFDRPEPRLIAERASDGKLYYIDPSLRGKWEGMSHPNPTPLERFGLCLAIEDGCLVGELAFESEATYENGDRRRWQGPATFRVPVPSEQMTAAATESHTPRTDAVLDYTAPEHAFRLCRELERENARLKENYPTLAELERLTQENAALRADAGRNTDEPDLAGSLWARLNAWKARCDELEADAGRLDKLEKLLWNCEQDCVILFPFQSSLDAAVKGIDIEASDDPCTGENICTGTTLRAAIDALPEEKQEDLGS